MIMTSFISKKKKKKKDGGKVEKLLSITGQESLNRPYIN